jgi:hypothetical protein
MHQSLYKVERDGTKRKTRGTVHFKLQPMLTDTTAPGSVSEPSPLAQAEVAIGNMQELPTVPNYVKEAVEEAKVIISDSQSVYDAWQSLLDRVDAVVKVVDIITEVIQR